MTPNQHSNLEEAGGRLSAETMNLAMVTFGSPDPIKRGMAAFLALSFNHMISQIKTIVPDVKYPQMPPSIKETFLEAVTEAFGEEWTTKTRYLFDIPAPSKEGETNGAAKDAPAPTPRHVADEKSGAAEQNDEPKDGFGSKNLIDAIMRKIGRQAGNPHMKVNVHSFAVPLEATSNIDEIIKAISEKIGVTPIKI